MTHATRDFLMPCLRLLPSEGTAFEMGLFALPDEEEGPLFRRNLVMFADVALNVEPTPAQLADIAVGACRTMRDLIPVEALPEIVGALVSYSTKGSGSGPSVERIRAAEPLIRERLARLREETRSTGPSPSWPNSRSAWRSTPARPRPSSRSSSRRSRGRGGPTC